MDIIKEWQEKLYVVSRKDLTPGQQAVQGKHSLVQFFIMHPDIIQKWHKESNYIVFLEAEDEEHLGQLMADAFEIGIYCAPFHEPDLNHDLTAVTFEPILKTRDLLKGLPLALK